MKHESETREENMMNASKTQSVRHPEEWTRFECGCEVGEDRHADAVVLHRLAYCPLHAHAPAMREVLLRLCEALMKAEDLTMEEAAAYRAACAILKAVEG